jgi:hypothetical protein
VRVEKHLQKGVHVAPLRLELLRHGDANDFAPVDLAEVERVFRWTKDLRDFRRQEMLEVVRDGFLDATDLLRRLIEKTILEMIMERGSPFGCISDSGAPGRR